MKEFLLLLKKGNKSALLAAIVNAVIAIIKGIGFSMTGNVALFAETMHSAADTANQLFVFSGSALSKKAPTDRFPNGFGRLVNLVLLGAVLIVGIMAYETIVEGIHHIIHPTHSSGLTITLVILAASTVLESFVLYKAMKEINHELGIQPTGFAVVTQAMANMGKAKPATKLVFLEDTVATLGGLLAMVAVIIAYFTPFHQAEGIASVIIGLLMFMVVGKVFLDNAAGVIGESDEEMEDKIGEMVMNDPDVKDIQALTVVKEGEDLHVELEIELDPSLTVAQADDIKDRLEEKIMQENGVTDVIIELDEDDGIQKWAEDHKKSDLIEK
ncbi:cation diffusion facilitator family transporter [Bacillus sp. AFS017336]|uniref:cation diffusion facilitator family transporter n=1 Tax=Bacillus sp. AFS017336 TaxID=2033489 RepID=UPI000BF126E7|nr:cation diffusion facilitator family transporter [Bacillus sp. AFS017336]PEL14225.1 cation diffusion facilitator family transporter [Bacillus sp. AFS017336]